MRHTYWCGHSADLPPARDTDEDWERHMRPCADCQTALDAEKRSFYEPLHRRDVAELERLCTAAIAGGPWLPYARTPQWLEEAIASYPLRRTVADIVADLCKNDAEFEAFQSRTSEEGCSHDEWEWTMYVGEHAFKKALDEVGLWISVQQHLRALGTTDISAHSATRLTMTVGRFVCNPQVRRHCAHCGESPLAPGQPVVSMSVDDDGPYLVCSSCAQEIFGNTMERNEENEDWAQIPSSGGQDW